MGIQTTWLLPSLRALLRGADAELWRRWLGRASRLPDGTFGARQAFADALGVPLTTLPWARACAAAELAPTEAARVVAIAEPIQTRVEVFNMRVLGSGWGALPDSQRAQLMADLNQYLQAEGLCLVAGAHHWYLCAEDGEWPDPQCLPCDSLLGSSLSEFLPQSLVWQRLLNELQVFLNQHAPLQAAKARGETQADSLWFWGGAASSPAAAVAWLEAEEFEFQALGSRLSLAAKAAAGGSGICERPFDPLDVSASLRRGRLRLNFACGARFVLESRDRWRFWAPAWGESS